MQPLPPGAAEAPDRAGGGGGGERDHQHERGQAHRDVRPLDDVGAHLAPGEEVVEHDPDREVQRGIAEGEEAEEAAQRHRPGPAEEEAQRRHGQAREQDAQGPVAQPVGDEADRVGGQIIRGRPVEKPRQRTKRRIHQPGPVRQARRFTKSYPSM